MAKKMSVEEYRAFLSEGTRTLKVATAGADGKPHVTPVWFVLDGDMLVFTTSEHSVKAKHLRRDPRISLSVDDEHPPYSFVLIQGTVEMTRNAPDLLAWTTKIAHRYMGDEQAEAYGKRNAVDEELLVRVTVNKVLAIRGISDW